MLAHQPIERKLLLQRIRVTDISARPVEIRRANSRVAARVNADPGVTDDHDADKNHRYAEANSKSSIAHSIPLTRTFSIQLSLIAESGRRITERGEAVRENGG